MKRFFIGLFALLLLAACSDDDKLPQLARNYILMTPTSATTLDEYSEHSVDVEVMLAYRLDHDATIRFALENNEDEVLSIDQPQLEFKAGDKVKSFHITANQKGVLKKPRTILLRVEHFTDPEMSPWGEPLAIRVEPGFKLPELTEKQKSLIEGYKERLGIDLYRMIGKLKCEVRVTFPKDETAVEDGDHIFSNAEIVTYPTETYFTLSEYATARKPMLKMMHNAMGLTSVFHKILNKEISISNQTGTQFPSVAEAVGYLEGEETLSMSLDSLIIEKNKSIQFMNRVFNSYGDKITSVPFKYDFSAWNRQEQMIADSAKVDIEVRDPMTGEIIYTEPMSPMKDLVEMGLSFNPEHYMIHSTIHVDDWGEGMWKAPSANYDFEKGTFSFRFPWDHMNSTDYTLIEVTYTMLPANE